MEQIFIRFLMFFGSSFLGIAVLIFSFLRRRMIKHGKQQKKKKRLFEQQKKQGWFPGK